MTSPLMVPLERAPRLGGCVEVEDRGPEFVPWLLPRIVWRRTRDGIDYHGVCRIHGWLTGPIVCVQDVPRCPDCAMEGEHAAPADRARFADALRLGLL